MLPLVRLALMEYFPLSALKNTTDAAAKKRARRRLTTTLVLLLACGYLSSVYSFAMAQAMQGRQLLLIPALMLAGGAILGLIEAVSRGGMALFAAATLDPLLSLPFSRGQIVLGRIFALYFEELLISLGMLLPAGVRVAGMLPVSGAFWPVLILGALLSPLLPLGVGGVIGLFVQMLTARMKQKNLLTALVSLLFMGGVFLFSFRSGTMLGEVGNMAGLLEQKLYSLYPPARWFALALGGSWPNMAFFALCSLLCGLALYALAKGCFTFFYEGVNATAHGKAFTMARQHRTGLLLALIKKELRQKLNTPMWLMNTDMGTIMAIILTVALGIAIKNAPPEQGFIGPNLWPLMALGVGVVQCMSLTAAASVSMEGKAIYAIKSLPIPAALWLRSKILVSMLPPMAGGLVCGLILTLLLKLPAYALPVFLLISTAFAWAFSVTELRLGLRYARFDWDNPTEVIKGGAGVFFSMLVTMAVLGVCVGLYFALGDWSLLLIFCLLLAFGALLWLPLKKNAEKKLTLL